LASAPYVALLDHDDVLPPHALAEIAVELLAHPAAAIVYSDEDKLDEQGRRIEPFCKPDWSPDLLLSCNYITHLLVVRPGGSWSEVGGLRPGFDGAQDHDLLLRLTEHPHRIVPCPLVLYSWRKSASATASDPAAKSAGARGQPSRDRRGHRASRASTAAHRGCIDPTWHVVRPPDPRAAAVSLIVPTRDRLDLLEPCIDLCGLNVAHGRSRCSSSTTGASTPRRLRYLEAFDAARVVRVRAHRSTTRAQMNLAALEAARGDVLVLLNNDTRPVGDGWFEPCWSTRPPRGRRGRRSLAVPRRHAPSTRAWCSTPAGWRSTSTPGRTRCSGATCATSRRSPAPA
jgi:O-antigen biosynthesis protein